MTQNMSNRHTRELIFALLAIQLIGVEVSTVAGGTEGVFANKHDTGTSASFTNIRGIHVYHNKIYVADKGMNRVAIVHPGAWESYKVDTFAGYDQTDAADSGDADGALGDARFNGPEGVWADVGSSKVYVADTGNHLIRTIDMTSGTVATLSGATGDADHVDNNLNNGRFNSPKGICVSGGKVYVADTGNNAIRELGSTHVTTFAGDGSSSSGSTDGVGTAARFNAPAGISADGNGNLYVADTGNHLIRKIVISTQTVSTIAGTGSSGSAVGLSGQFDSPVGVVIGSCGNLYVADQGNCQIRRIRDVDGQWFVEVMAGSSCGTTDGEATAAAKFQSISGIGIDDSDGKILVSDDQGGSSTVRALKRVSGGSIYNVNPSVVAPHINVTMTVEGCNLPMQSSSDPLDIGTSPYANFTCSSTGYERLVPWKSVIGGTHGSVNVNLDDGCNLDHFILSICDPTRTGCSEAANVFATLDTPTVTDWNPKRGPSHGGTTVTITGTNFDTSSAMCVFGDTYTEPATTPTATNVECVLGNMTMANDAMVELFVANNRFQKSASAAAYYDLIDDPVITSIAPIFGSPQQMVTVEGTGFATTGAVYCGFGTMPSEPAYVESNTMIMCATPSSGVTAYSKVTVRASNNGADFSSSAQLFTYLMTDITRVMPPLGPASGGTVVALEGSGFAPSSALACKFGTHSSTATFMSATSVHCNAPSVTGAPKGLDLNVTVNGVDYTSAPEQYWFQTALSSLTVSPTTGTQLAPTSVTISGTGVSMKSSIAHVLTCRFRGTQLVNGTVNAAGDAVCETPPFRNVDNSTGISVELSNNGQDFTAITNTYEVLDTKVTSIVPRYGSVVTGTTVDVMGYNFASANMMCKFGTNAAVAATVQGPGQLTCDAPPSPVSLPVYLSNNNGVSFSDDSSIQLETKSAPTVTAVDPATGPVSGSMVTFLGSGFVPGTIECKFGNVPAGEANSTGLWLSSTAAKCMSPSGRSEGMITDVEAGNEWSVWSSNNMTYYYQSDLSVTSMTPLNGSSETPVTLYGSGFSSKSADLGYVKCAFGGKVVDGTRLSSSAISCAAPRNLTGTVYVNVTQNQNDFVYVGDFTYTSEMAAIRISPRWGPLSGFTKVTIDVSPNGEKLFLGTASCKFGTIEAVSRTLVSDTQIVCLSPPQAASGAQSVVVANSPPAWSDANNVIVFDYLPTTAITALVPDSGPKAGGTVVFVMGTNMVQKDDLRCQFRNDATGATAVSAGTFMTNTKVRCLSEAGTTWANVSLSFNTENFTSPYPFLYQDAVTISNVYPPQGSYYGGTNVTVEGSNFSERSYFMSTLKCQFGSIHTPVNASFVSSTAIRCTSPYLFFQSLDETTIPISVTNNDFDYVASAALYTIRRPAVVTSISPVTGSPYTNVTVSGYGFGGPGQRCKFGTYEPTNATSFNDNEIFCVVPDTTGSVVVEVSANNMDYTSNRWLFTYMVSPTATGISPALGPISGGTIVSVYGANLERSATPTCKFDAAVGPAATYLTSTLVLCLAPSGTAGTTDAIELSSDGTLWTSGSGLAYSFHSIPTVTQVAPSIYSEEGNITLTIDGSDFLLSSYNDGYLECRLDHDVVNATWISTTQVLCHSPHMLPKFYYPEVSLNGQDYYASSQAVHVVTDPQVSLVEPAIGFSGGGTLVTVNGTNFDDSGNYKCAFGTTVVTATRVTNDSLTCTSPNHGSVEYVFLEVSNDGGVTYSASRNTFFFNGNPTVSALEPSSGPEGGDTLVFVSGTNYKSAPSVSCKVGTTLVTGTYLTTTQIMCRTPTLSAGAYNLEVSNNDVTFSANSVQFTYYSKAFITAVTPNYGSTAGGVTTTIDGGVFHSTQAATMYCRFGSLEAKATRTDNTRVTCTSPAQVSSGAVDVVITQNKQNITYSGLAEPQFTYHGPITITEVSPSVGKYDAGDEVTVIGTNMMNSGNLKANIGGTVVAVKTFFSSSMASFIVPTVAAPAAAGSRVSLEVTNNGVDYSVTGAHFTYTNGLTISGGPTPSIGPIRGGTMITVEFNAATSVLHNNPYLACKVNGTICDTRWLSVSSMGCITPPVAVTSNNFATVEVSESNKTFVSTTTMFSYLVRVPEVYSIVPRGVPRNVAALVNITGYNLEGGNLHVKFGTETCSPLTHVSHSLVQCKTPATAAAGSESLSISLDDGAHFLNMREGIIFREAHTITAARPQTVAVSGSTLLTLDGANFMNSENMYCKISITNQTGYEHSVQEKATFMSRTSVRCRAPNPFVYFNGTTYNNTDSDPWGELLLLPIQWNDTATVTLTNNNQDYTVGSGATIYYQNWHGVTSISPTVGRVEGGTPVDINGYAFSLRSASLGYFKCKFGTSAPVAATYVSPQQLKVVSPPLDESSEDQDLNLFCTSNDKDYTQAGDTGNPVTFSVRARSRITSVTPSLGYMGNTTVTVSGIESWSDTDTFKCRFGSTEVAATKVSGDDSVLCLTPVVFTDNVNYTTTVDISNNNGIDWTSSSFPFQFGVTLPQLTSISPTSGSEDGSEIVTMMGDFFNKTFSASCAFGGTVQAGTWISTTEVQCSTPAQTGSAVVEVSLNNVDFTYAGFSFEFLPGITITNIGPSSGPTSGGTLVSVEGTNFPQSSWDASTLKCRFQEIYLVPATFSTSTSITCASPTVTSATSGTIDVTANDGSSYSPMSAQSFEWSSVIQIVDVEPIMVDKDTPRVIRVYGEGYPATQTTNLRCRFADFDPNSSTLATLVSTSEVLCLTPVDTAGTHPVEITQNNVDYSNELYVLFAAFPTVTGTTPVVRPASGESIITLEGTGFTPYRAIELKCQWTGSSVVQNVATRVSDTAVLCSSPADTAGMSAYVNITVNNLDFTTDYVTLEYQSDIILSSVDPDAGTNDQEVNVFGSGFSQRSATLGLIRCAYRDRVVTYTTPTFVTSTNIKCIVPGDEVLLGSSQIEVSQNDQDYSGTNAIYYTQQAPLTVTAISPSEGWAEQYNYFRNTLLTIDGSNFEDKGTNLKCSYGPAQTAIGPATFVTFTQVLCRSEPSGSTGFVNVFVAKNYIPNSNPSWSASSEDGRVYFRPPVVITSVSPSFGAVSTTQTLTIDGAFVDNEENNGLACRFLKTDGTEETSSAGTYKTSTQVECASPSVASDGFYMVQVRMSSLMEWSASSLDVFYFVTSTYSVTSISPSRGQAAGGTAVTFSGTGYNGLAMESGLTKCKFGTTEVVPDSLSLRDGTITCKSPAGTLSTSLSTYVLNDGFTAGSSAAFTYDEATITAITPNSVSQIGGTTITIDGTGLDGGSSGANTKCRLDGSVGVSTYVSATQIKCLAPVITGKTLKADVQAEVSINNGEDWNGAFKVETWPPISLPDFTPTTVNYNQRSDIDVVASNLATNLELLKCRFGGYSALGANANFEIGVTETSGTKLVCQSPTALETDEMRGAQLTALEISVNGGYDWSAYSNNARFVTLILPMLSLEVNPSRGSQSGGSLVTVRGQAFRNTGYCRYEDPLNVYVLSPSTSQFTLLSQSEILCVTPPSPAADVAEIKVFVELDEGVSSGVSHAVFEYSLPSNVYDLTPDMGSLIGGTVVTVDGAAYVNGANKACRFNTTWVEASFVSATRVLCAAPVSNNTGFVDFKYSNNMVDLSVETTLFLYQGIPVVNGLLPSIGPAGGGNDVTVKGSGFSSRSYGASLLSCKFGSMAVLVKTYFNETMVVCEVPVQPSGNQYVEMSTDFSVYSSDQTQYTYADLYVNSIFPLGGFVSGGSMVTVTSDTAPGFAMIRDVSAQILQPMVCQFGTFLEAPARRIEQDKMECVVPLNPSPAPCAGMTSGLINAGGDNEACIVPMRIAVIDSWYENAGQSVAVSPDFNYYFYKNAVPISLNPSQLSAGGGMITIDGNKMDAAWGANTNYRCRIGTVVVTATQESATRFTCLAPIGSAGEFDLDFSVNSQDFDNMGKFSYKSHNLEYLNPNLIYPEGNSKLRVIGSEFSSNDVLTCQYHNGPSAVPELYTAAWVSSTELVCNYPAMAVGQWAVSVINSRGDNVTLPLGSLMVIDRPAVVTFSPSVLLMDSQQMVFVMGTNIWYENYISATEQRPIINDLTNHPGGYNTPLISEPHRCQFGDQVSIATFLEMNVLMCRAPQGVSGVVELEVSSNSFDYSTSGLTIEIEDIEYGCPNGKFCPDFQVTECPRGTKCTGRSYNFTLCEPGEYNPNIDSDSCSDCAAGGICGDSGMSRIEKCPAGSVCNSTGLDHADHSKCPPGYYCPGEVTEFIGTGSSAPQQCPENTYCPFGAMTGDAPNVTTTNFSNPQSCFKGFTCSVGTGKPIGQQECPSGKFCTPAENPCEPGYSCFGGNTFPVPCLPGQYQPDPEQATCLDCPVGTFCSEFATATATPCTPGTICNEPKKAGPNKLCTAGYFCAQGVSSDVPVTGDFATPQICPTGVYCLAGSTSNCTCTWCGLEPAECAIDDTGAFLPGIPDSDLVARQIDVALDCTLRGICKCNGFTQEKFWEVNAYRRYSGSAFNAADEALTDCDGDISYPQVCVGGTYCKPGSDTPKGTDTCPIGHYCPPGSSAPIPVPAGTYAPDLGNDVPIVCIRGYYSKYNGTHGTSECIECPAGTECVESGMDTPVLCSAGTYREFGNASVTCINCPAGTYSNLTGLTSDTECTECPPGIVCANEGTVDISGMPLCPNGFVCDNRTTGVNQFDLKCPAGYYCGAGTTPDTQFDYLCPAGFMCNNGTTNETKTKLPCEVGFYCEIGSCQDVALPCGKKPCPDGTSSVAGVSSKYSCVRTDLRVLAEVDGNKDKTGAEPIFVDTSTTDYWAVAYSANAYSYYTFFVNWTAVDVTSLSYTNAADNDDVWRINFKNDNDDDLTPPSLFFEKLLAGYSTKNWNLTDTHKFLMVTKEPVMYRLAIDTLHGVYTTEMAAAFENTMETTYVEMNRSRMKKPHVFVASLFKTAVSTGVQLPLNVDQQELAAVAGYMEFKNEDDPFMEIPTQDTYDERFVGVANYWSGTETIAVFSYMPFLSMCYGFDSYVPTSYLFEHPDCDRVAFDETFWVNPWDFANINSQNYLLADQCHYSLKCHYEEDQTLSDVTPYWTSLLNGDEIFTLSAFPLDPADYANYKSFFKSNKGKLGALAVKVVRPPNAAKGNYPSKLLLRILYYQQDGVKKLVRGFFEMTEFHEPDNNDPEYEFTFDMMPLDYLSLMNFFELDPAVYVLMYFVISGMMIGGISVFWCISRFCALCRPKYRPQAFNIWKYLRYIGINPLKGAIFMGIPFFVSFFFVWLFIKVGGVVNHISGDMTDPNMATWTEVEDSEILTWQSMRIGYLFLTLGLYNIYNGLPLFVPDSVTSSETRTERKDRKRKQVFEEDTGIYSPAQWKRTHMLLITFCIIFVLLYMIELSYSRLYKTYTFYCLLGIKFGAAIVKAWAGKFMREKMLMAPLDMSLSLAAFVTSLGAPEFFSFIYAFFMSLGIGVVVRVYVKPLNYKIKGKLKAKINARKQKKLEAERAAYIEQMRARGEDVDDDDGGDDESMQMDVGCGLNDLLDSLTKSGNENLALIFAPFVILFFYLFGEELKVAEQYNIRLQDLLHYIYFSTIIGASQMIVALFLFNIVEITWGWRILQYLEYARHRFNTRRTRWKGNDGRINEFVAPGMRTVDQMCFSSQYFFMISYYVGGMMTIVLAFQFLLRSHVNPVKDILMVPLCLLMLLLAQVVRIICKWIGSKVFRIWMKWDKSQGDIIEEEEEEDDAGLLAKIQMAEQLAKIMMHLYTSGVITDPNQLVTAIGDVMQENTGDLEGAQLEDMVGNRKNREKWMQMINDHGRILDLDMDDIQETADQLDVVDDDVLDARRRMGMVTDTVAQENNEEWPEELRF